MRKQLYCDIDSTINNHWVRIKKWALPSFPGSSIDPRAFSREEIMKDKDAKRWIDIWCRNMTTWATILKKANPSKYVQHNTNRPKYT